MLYTGNPMNVFFGFYNQMESYMNIFVFILNTWRIPGKLSKWRVVNIVCDTIMINPIYITIAGCHNQASTNRGACLVTVTVTGIGFCRFIDGRLAGLLVNIATHHGEPFLQTNIKGFERCSYVLYIEL